MTIAEAERALAAAHRTLDLDPDGTTETKARVLASFRSGERHWDEAEVD